MVFFNWQARLSATYYDEGMPFWGGGVEQSDVLGLVLSHSLLVGDVIKYRLRDANPGLSATLRLTRVPGRAATGRATPRCSPSSSPT